MRNEIIKILKENKKLYLILLSWLHENQEGILKVSLRNKYDTREN